MTVDKAEKLQGAIKYKFRYPEILVEALTRRASANEKTEDKEKFMDPLATLGDAILDAIVVLRLYEKGNRSKGKITQEKIDQVGRKKTQAFAKKLNLQEYVDWGEGSGNRKRVGRVSKHWIP